MSSSSAQQQPQSLHKINTHEQVRLVRCASSRSWRSLTQSRSQYLSEGIPSAGSLDRDPITQFERWFAHAESDSAVPEPEAFALASVSPSSGVPSSRIVLLKRVDSRGFVFFTNYNSRKGSELGLAEGGQGGRPVAATWYWRAQHRSVRVTGVTERVSAEETDEYYHTRPRGSQIGAWASPQSQPLKSDERGELEQLVSETETRFKDADEVPVPPFWGGVRIVPREIEFWMGRESRLHDRFRFTRDDDKAEWQVARLAP